MQKKNATRCKSLANWPVKAHQQPDKLAAIQGQVPADQEPNSRVLVLQGAIGGKAIERVMTEPLSGACRQVQVQLQVSDRLGPTLNIWQQPGESEMPQSVSVVNVQELHRAWKSQAWQQALGPAAGTAGPMDVPELLSVI